jgi:hypothetical protein
METSDFVVEVDEATFHDIERVADDLQITVDEAAVFLLKKGLVALQGARTES